MSGEWACDDCAWICNSEHALEVHRARSSACRVIRAKRLAEERRNQGRDPPPPPILEERPLHDDQFPNDGPLDNFHVLEDAEPPQEPVTLRSDPQAPGNEANAKKRIFDSCEQVAAFVKRNKLSGTQTDELLKLWADDRLRLQEVVSTFQSHRDVDRYLLASIVGETAKQVNLQRPGVDPRPVLLTYRPALDVIKELCANTQAAKDGFTVKPVIRQVISKRRQEDGTIVEEVRRIDVPYDHPNTGTFWERAQAEIDADPAYEGPHVLIPIIVHIDKTTLDGLRKYSAFPVYISIANYSWKTYNEQGGMVLVALLPQPEADPDWAGPGYKPDSEGFRDTKRYFMHGGLGLLFESTRQASFTGFEFVDPFGTKRKGVPLLYAICKDLGEASSISGVRSNCCDSCSVPRTELNQLRPALAGTHPTRTEAAMAPRIREVLDLKAEGAPQCRITEKCQEYQLHPVEPWFFGWKYGDRDWNSPYLKMAPDDLHSVYGGVLGTHMPAILTAAAELLPKPMTVTKFLQLMDVRLHRNYLHHKPGHLRLPASPTFFSKSYATPNYEWKAVMQVLPALVAGLFRAGGRDVLVEWAVALCDWGEAQFYPKDDAHTDASLARADELLLAFETKCEAIAGLQNSRWNFRKFHELALFSRFVKILGSHKWYSTERGERQHHWVKIWWEMMNGRDIDKGLHKQWTMALALDEIESQRAALQQLASHREHPYDSAIVTAIDKDMNSFALNYRAILQWSDLLVDPADPHSFRAEMTHEYKKLLLQLLRAQPLLSELPVALGTTLGRENGLDSFDPLDYLRANYSPRLRVFVSAYIVPHEGGRKALQALRAWPDYFGRPQYSDLGVQGNTGDKWVGHALLFFSVGELTSEWCEERDRRIPAIKWTDYVFVRWYSKKGYRDAVACDIYEWATAATSRGREAVPDVDVIPLESVLAEEQMLPKVVATRSKTQFYLNKYLR